MEITKVSAHMFLQRKTKDRPVGSYIKELLGHLEFHLFAVWEYRSLNVPRSSRFIIQFLIITSSCEVSLRKQFQKTPGICRTSWVCD